MFSSTARVALATVASALFNCATAFAQSVSVRDLPKATRDIAEPFSQISIALEIKPAKVLVVDGIEAIVKLVDFTTGSVTAIGRQGNGPGEYQMPTGVSWLQGDTLLLFDYMQQRVVPFKPDLSPGTPFTMLMFDYSTSTSLTQPILGDQLGRVYASAMKREIRARGGQTQYAVNDSVALVRLDPRGNTRRAELARLKFRYSGTPEVKEIGNVVKYTMAFPGLVAFDPWTVFPDGRVAIVRGATYTVEFITPDGKKSSAKIPYEPIKVTAADRKAEMNSAQSEMGDRRKVMQRMMSAGVTAEFDLLPPAEWPADYPPAAGALSAPDGNLWVKRAMPVRLGREQWDVINPAGNLVARWRLEPRTTLVAVGRGVVYAARTSEDGLRYLQRVEVGR